jgi:hypothetical protein
MGGLNDGAYERVASETGSAGAGAVKPLKIASRGLATQPTYRCTKRVTELGAAN